MSRQSANVHPEGEPPIVLAITGASGSIYAARLLRGLLASGRDVHLTISPSGAAVIRQELELTIDLKRFDPEPLIDYRPNWSDRPFFGPAPDLSRLRYHHYQDYMTPIASGSFLTAGMVICPCSGSTMAGIAHAASTNLVQRAAEVHLKERRRLVLVPRETPLSTFALENMHRISVAGGVVLPAMPGWYHGASSLDDLVDFIVSRILDQFAIPNSIIARWDGREAGESAR
ncbi:MAG: UbiX family flavin prenyltransferase [Planctomycetaceae bacterium]|nr:MAG: UbiX family flavin prenyltransferase [Planctomycetaceae bacterium]